MPKRKTPTATTEMTSARIAAIAARGLKTGKLTAAEIKAVCASCLTQKAKALTSLTAKRKRSRL